MIQEQIGYWKKLRWYELVMVIIACGKGAMWFQIYLDTLIFVVKHLALK